MPSKPMKGESRTIEQIREHYEIEKALASKLKQASKEERRHLYSSLYNEMFQQVPLHPQLTRKASSQETELYIAGQMSFIKPFLRSSATFLEIGPGDCSLSFEVAKFVKQIYAIDVSDEITRSLTLPSNFQLILSDGSDISVASSSIDIAYSNQLMEHLHAEDAFEQLQNIYQALTPGGIYICITPNRLNGPHDVSGYFDEMATGFHLKEYTTSELGSLFQKTGFSQVRAHIGARGKYMSLPIFPISWCEAWLSVLPKSLRRKIARNLPFNILLGIRLVATK
jgi:SAM-dependent methyltransferase